MSILDALRSGVKVADGVTKSLQSTVSYQRYVSEPNGADPGYGTVVKLKAIVDSRVGQTRTIEGVVNNVRCTITLLDVAAVKAATNGAGISRSDKFTLQDGTTGPTLDVSGFVDAGTGKLLATEVMLG